MTNAGGQGLATELVNQPERTRGFFYPQVVFANQDDAGRWTCSLHHLPARDSPPLCGSSARSIRSEARYGK
ncbi:MAG: hypothetical protein RL077_4746 [Verrucomicrobiota bacterium]